ncbi:hypothetical protein FRC03_004343 [Tulasnella sp. 419]|nr:hypothetical protein FRC03_004343 [Tulasnella sp. 419]
MDLSLLRDSLPSSTQAAADRELLKNFKAAALSITTLYKSSLNSSKKAYNSGYAACLSDMLNFIQAGVSSIPSGHDGTGALGLDLNIQVDGGGMTIGRVMDWVEARMEAIRSDDEDDDEEQQRAKSTTTTTNSRPPVIVQPVSTTRPTSVPSTAVDATAHQSTTTLIDTEEHPRATSPRPQRSVTVQSPLPSSPPSIPPPPQPPFLTRSRSKSRQALGKERETGATIVPPHAPFTFTAPIPTTFEPHNSTDNEDSDSTFHLSVPSFSLGDPIVGSKRRHSTMVSEIAPSQGSSRINGHSGFHGVSSASSSSRRRTRGNTSSANSRNVNMTDAEAMEVEEEPARKRVARR